MQIAFHFLQVNDTNLHEFLDNHEREFIFGNNPESELNGSKFKSTQILTFQCSPLADYSYKLLNVIKKKSRLRRSLDLFDRKVNLHLRLERNESQPMRLSMQKSTDLVDDNFVFIQRFDDANSIDNRTKIADRSAALQGIQDCFYRSSEAALDLCDTNRLQGILKYRNEEYMIFPLPERFGKKSVHILTPSTKSRYHLIHKHELSELLLRKRRSIGSEKSSAFSNSSTPTTKPKVLHIETAIFVDKDLYRHMAKNYPKNTETHLIRFVLAMINGVQLLYHHPSLGREVNFVLKRLEILHKDPKDLRRSSDIDTFLNSFCLWQRKFNPVSDTDATHFDHAVILTGLVIFDSF